MQAQSGSDRCACEYSRCFGSFGSFGSFGGFGRRWRNVPPPHASWGVELPDPALRAAETAARTQIMTKEQTTAISEQAGSVR